VKNTPSNAVTINLRHPMLVPDASLIITLLLGLDGRVPLVILVRLGLVLFVPLVTLVELLPLVTLLPLPEMPVTSLPDELLVVVTEVAPVVVVGITNPGGNGPTPGGGGGAGGIPDVAVVVDGGVGAVVEGGGLGATVGGGLGATVGGGGVAVGGGGAGGVDDGGGTTAFRNPEMIAFVKFLVTTGIVPEVTSLHDAGSEKL